MIKLYFTIPVFVYEVPRTFPKCNLANVCVSQCWSWSTPSTAHFPHLSSQTHRFQLIGKVFKTSEECIKMCSVRVVHKQCYCFLLWDGLLSLLVRMFYMIYKQWFQKVLNMGILATEILEKMLNNVISYISPVFIFRFIFCLCFPVWPMKYTYRGRKRVCNHSGFWAKMFNCYWILALD